MALGKTSPAKTMVQKVNHTRLARWEWIALIGLLLLAAWLRLGRTGVIEFKRDEATLSRLALDVARADNWTWLGIGSSVGFPNAPLNIYLFAIPYAVSDNPLIATLFVGYLNIIGVVLVWAMTRRYFGPHAALIAAVLLAASPWGALYARKIWAQDLLPPFVLLTAFTGILGFIEGKRWAQLVHLPLLAITVQLHFGAVTWLPISALLMLMGWRKWSKWFWGSMVLAGLLSLPFLYGLYNADMLSVSALRDSLDQATEGGQPRDRGLQTTAFDHAWLVVAGRDIHALAGEEAFQDYLDTIPPVYDLFSTVPILALFSVPVLGYQAHQRRDLRLWLILTVWLILPVISFTYTWAEPQPHYMLPMLPVAFVLIGALLGQAWRWTLAPYGIIGGVAVIVLLQVIVLIRLLDFLADTNTPQAFGTPLAYQLPIRDEILAHHPQRVIVVSSGNSPQYDQEPAVWDLLLDRVPNVDFLAADSWWIQPADVALMLVAPDAQLSTWPTHLTGSSIAFPLRKGEGNYQLWVDVAVQMPTDPTPIEGRFANGIYLESVQRAEDGVWVVWRVPQPITDTLPIAFVHGINAAGQRIQQVDRPFVAERYWVADDRVIGYMPMLLADVETLRIGLYVLVGEAQFQNIEHLDASGAYVDQWLALPMVQLD